MKGDRTSKTYDVHEFVFFSKNANRREKPAVKRENRREARRDAKIALHREVRSAD